MPLVRIDLPAETSATEAAAVSRAVHQALVDVFGVPQDDLFQVISRRPPGEIVCTPQFLGIPHSDRVAFVHRERGPVDGGDRVRRGLREGGSGDEGEQRERGIAEGGARRARTGDVRCGHAS